LYNQETAEVKAEVEALRIALPSTKDKEEVEVMMTEGLSDQAVQGAVHKA
jgi:hypothetical protein